MKNLSQPIAMFVVSVLSLGASAQADTTGIGGAEERAAYTYAESPVVVEGDISEEWDVNDSLVFIPGYDTYCDWNTETIFPVADAATHRAAPTSLQLSVAACDHAFPKCGKVNSPFGQRHGRMHYGVDLELETGDPVVCAFPGVVRVSRYHKSFGNVVVVRHWNGLETLYAHLSSRSVEPGTAVEAGDSLGLGGNTGRSTGSHLHFEVRFLGKPIDPKFIFDLQTGELKSEDLIVSKGLFETPATSRSYHIVRRGDTLSAIAKRYGTNVTALRKMNKIGSRSVLRVGQRVRYR